MTDRGDTPGGHKRPRVSALDPSALLEDSERPVLNAPRPKTHVIGFEENSAAERSDATQLVIEESFSSFSTDGGTDESTAGTTENRELDEGTGTGRTHLVAGTFVSGYILQDLLGTGTYAEVFRARHAGSGREVALKVLRQALAFDESIRRRVLREGEILRQLRHPNLVEVYDLGVLEDGRAFVAMELLSGRTLKELLIAEAPLSPERAFRLTEEVAKGLEAVHAAGIVHRDLKPANIFVGGAPPNEQVKLLDFGLARFVDRGEFTQLTRAGDLIGSPGFMAPEQIQNAGTADARADLYALGVTAYAMVMGRLPFVGRTHDVLRAQAHATADPLPHLGGFEAVVAALMSKEPEDRPASASGLLARLREVDETTLSSSGTWLRIPSSTQDPALVQGVVERPRDRLLLVASALLALSLVAMGGVIYLKLTDREDAPVEPAPPTPALVAIAPHPPPPTPASPAGAEAEVEPEPELGTTEAPGAKALRPRTGRGSRGSEPASTKPQPIRPRAELTRALRARSLRFEDAGALLPDEPTLRDSSPAREELDALLGAVARAPLSGALLRTRLTRLLGKLGALSESNPPPEQLPDLEARYFRARETLARAREERSKLEALNLQIDALESALEAAKK